MRVSVRRPGEQIGILVDIADGFNPLEWFKITDSPVMQRVKDWTF
jgi:hypothetical protein